MTKHFCDRCKEETPESKLRGSEFKLINKRKDEYDCFVAFDVCDKCGKEIIDILEGFCK